MTPRPLQVEGIDHVVLKVSDLKRSIEFFVEVLGLHLERFYSDFGFCHIRCGRNMIDLQVLPANTVLSGPGQQGLDHICINVRGDIDQIVAYLTERQVKMRSAPSEVYGATGFSTSVYVYDPDSHLIELKTDYCQYPLKSTVAEALGASTRPPASK